MRPYYSQIGIPLLPLVVALGAAGSAWACPGDDVHVTVVSILATDKNDKVDEKLTELAKRIKERRPDLTGFRIDTQCCEKLAVDQSKEFKCLGNKCAAVVTVRQAADADNKVRLKVELPCIGTVCYTTCCGKFFPMMTCKKTDKNEWLIIAVMVKPCKGK